MMRKLSLWSFLIVVCVAVMCCQKEIRFDDSNNNSNPDPVPGDSLSQKAVFTLEGSPGNCVVDSIWGTYAKGVPLNDAALRIRVNVTQKGEFAIATNEVNGIFFSLAGVFQTTGAQTVDLIGDGIPTEPGSFSYTIDTPATPCSFSVNVLEPVAVTSNDYFPLTAGSYWSYEDLTPIADTMMRTVTDTRDAAGNTYIVFTQVKKYGLPSTYLFRKDGDEYFEYSSVDKYTSSLSYTTEIDSDLHFLGQLLYKGSTWTTDEFTGAITGGQSIALQYVYTCIEKDATVTLNGNTFANVYVISMRPQVRSLDNGFNNTGEEYFYYYAKGIGLIYMLKLDQGARQMEWRIKKWHIN